MMYCGFIVICGIIHSEVSAESLNQAYMEKAKEKKVNKLLNLTAGGAPRFASIYK